MKLKYVKPAFAVERFDLAQSIAANCTAENPANPSSSLGDPGWGSADTCGWCVGEYTIWTMENCNKNPDYAIIAGPHDEVLGFCYNNPSGDNVIFRS